ncbi:MAG: GldG family protein [Nitrospirae bacterium]|nr:GldG family protein [Nitrospirota bacterium]
MMHTLTKGAGWLGILTAIAGFLAYEINPDWKPYVSLAELAALGLLVLFFIVHFEALKSFSLRRSTRLGLNSVLMVLIFIAILGISNFILSRHHVRFDFSETESFSLAPQTVQVLKDLNRDVKILAFVSDQGRTRSQIKDLLSSYGYQNPRITYTLIDPDKKPSEAKQYGIIQYDTLVLQSGKQETQIKTASEQELTNAIIRIGQDERRKILFLEGHGEHGFSDPEKTGYSRVKDALQKQGFDVGTLSLLSEGKVPDKTTALVIAGPQKGFLPQEKAALENYFSANGKVLLLLDPDVRADLDDLLSRWGIRMGKGLIIDTFSRLLGGDFTIPVVTTYPPHEITQGFNIATFFPVSQSVNFDPGRAVEYDYKPLAQTGDNSWSKTHPGEGRLNFNPAEDVRGPLTLAAVVTRKPKGGAPEQHSHDAPADAGPGEPETGESQPTLIVFGDSDFAANGSFNFSGNGDLFLNTVTWLAQEKGLISIRPKETRFTPLFLSQSQGKVLMTVSLLLLPAAVFTTGIVIWRRRRRL